MLVPQVAHDLVINMGHGKSLWRPLTAGCPSRDREDPSSPNAAYVRWHIIKFARLKFNTTHDHLNHYQNNTPKHHAQSSRHLPMSATMSCHQLCAWSMQALELPRIFYLRMLPP